MFFRKRIRLVQSAIDDITKKVNDLRESFDSGVYARLALEQKLEDFKQKQERLQAKADRWEHSMTSNRGRWHYRLIDMLSDEIYISPPGGYETQREAIIAMRDIKNRDHDAFPAGHSYEDQGEGGGEVIS